MSRSVLDLTPAELDKLARDAWSDAARQALERGLPVSGSRDGRRFRYHPDRRIEDLGPAAETTVTAEALAMPNVNSPKLHFQGNELPEAYREMAEVRFSQASDAYQKATAEVQAATILAELIPEQMRALAEKSLSQARDSLAKFKDATDTHNGTVEAALTAASKGASEYSAKLMEIMKANTTATLDFAQELLGVKSPIEAMELWTAHAKKQFEALSANAKELAELSQRELSGRITEATKAHRGAKKNGKDSSVA